MKADAQVIRIPCLPVSQPIGRFYVGVINSQALLRIAVADVRTIAEERRDVETYLGIERPLNPKRVEEIKRYVNSADASFPSSIIVAVAPEDARYSESAGSLYLDDREDVAKILDGQHRLAGLRDYAGPQFDLVVTVFVDMDIENQAMMFATINLEQKTVSKSLAYDLYDLVKSRSPQKTAHNIVRLLDREEGSPLRGRIKVLGTAQDPGETISQAFFVEQLLPLITTDAKSDRDALKKGRRLKPLDRDDGRSARLVFRNMFIDERDAEIARIVWNYLLAVRDRWPSAWDLTRQGSVLNRSTGFGGLMKFLPYAYVSVAQPNHIPAAEAFSKLFSNVDLTDDDFTANRFVTGTGGQTALRDELLKQTAALRGPQH